MRARMVRLSKFLAVAPAFLLLGACAYVPLSTMAKLYSFDERDFAELDPSVIKIRVTVPVDFEVSVEDSRMDVQVESAGQQYDGELKMTDKRRLGEIDSGAFGERETKDRKIYTLRLSDESVAEFARLQRSLSGRRVDSSKINISAVLKSAPCDAEEVLVNVDLSPKPADGFIAIVDGAKIKIDKGSPNRACTPPVSP